MEKLKLNGEYSIEELNSLIEEAKKSKFLNEGKYYLNLNIHGRWEILTTSIENVYKNHYQTQKEAEKHAKYFQLFTDLYFFAKENNKGWIPDYNDSNQFKWGISRNECDFIVDWYCTTNYFLFGIVFRSQKTAEKALEKFKDRLEDYLNIQI